MVSQESCLKVLFESDYLIVEEGDNRADENYSENFVFPTEFYEFFQVEVAA